MTLQELTTLAQHTSELYHELNALDRFDQDYRRKLEEVESLNLPKRGENLMILQSELKQQRKLVRSLKKKSLWSRTLEEIMEKLVDIVTYMHQVIFEAFGEPVQKETTANPQKLGVAGLALHYANVIHQIDNIAARPASLPPNIRDTLYHGLPPAVKKALRSRILSMDNKEERSISQVKDEMEKTLQWLVPVATNTTKAHQGFGWVGEWANTGNEFGRSAAGSNSLTRLQTLYHADKQKTDAYILELVAWLHQLINLVKQRDHGFKPQPVRSPTYKGLEFHSKMQRYLSFNGGIKPPRVELSQEDRNLLNKGHSLTPAGTSEPATNQQQNPAAAGVPQGEGNNAPLLPSAPNNNIPKIPFAKPTGNGNQGQQQQSQLGFQQQNPNYPQQSINQPYPSTINQPYTGLNQPFSTINQPFGATGQQGFAENAPFENGVSKEKTRIQCVVLVSLLTLMFTFV
ncbi:hypothetical protein COLO4_26138 [Corchorus olitorius]|uniref:DUF668 domain-containing protein n=1 Tax=Corchorus olitorius TaxID=93759 RepID=A0A1R3HYV7_9ROSI|nr:hypothetical protein COLO4_26138 [Corchorus olitorius]